MDVNSPIRRLDFFFRKMRRRPAKYGYFCNKNSIRMLDKMKSRRTVRRYTDAPVSEELLTELLQAACRAATTGNMQLYTIVVTRSAEGKARLAPAHFNQPMVTGAPVVLTFCADFARFSAWCEMRQAEPCYNNFQSYTAAASDALLAAQAFCTAAEDAGLGTCMLGTTTYNAAQIIETLDLPPLVVPVITVTLGWPESLPEQPERLPLEAVVHDERYVPNTPARIDALYADKESIEVNRKFVEENGKQTLAQVFTDVRYPRRNNEFFSEAFLQVLRKQGFLD
jgi:nitroreductase